MPSRRQRLIAAILRRYPFYSGCGSLANSKLVRVLAGPVEGDGRAWARVPGGGILVDLGDYVGRAAFYVGDLDRKITWICERIVRPGDTVVDVGANVGLVTVWLSFLVGARGHVFAFEPNPALREFLAATAARNRLENVTFTFCALGREPGSVALHVPCEDAGKASVVQHRAQPGCSVFRVPSITLSDFARERDIRSIRLLKLDVEGFEFDVLTGSEQVLRDVRPEAILFEVNRRSRGSLLSQPEFELLRRHGYGFFRVPRRLVRMRLERIADDMPVESAGNDFLAVPLGEPYERVAALVGAGR